MQERETSMNWMGRRAGRRRESADRKPIMEAESVFCRRTIAMGWVRAEPSHGGGEDIVHSATTMGKR